MVLPAGASCNGPITRSLGASVVGVNGLLSVDGLLALITFIFLTLRGKWLQEGAFEPLGDLNSVGAKNFNPMTEPINCAKI